MNDRNVEKSRVAGHGRVAAVRSSICLPNSGHSTRSPGSHQQKLKRNPDRRLVAESTILEKCQKAVRRHNRPTADCRKLDFGLLRDLKRVIYLDSEVTNGTLQLAMPEQKLNRSQVLRPLINQRCLGSPHGVRAIDCRIESDCSNPLMDDPGVLSGRNMW